MEKHIAHSNLYGINESNDDADVDDNDEIQYNKSVPLVHYPLLTVDFYFSSTHPKRSENFAFTFA